jgi:hypothetical protein
MDAVVAFGSAEVGVAEIELSEMLLESPRALLEDVAVLHGRYGIPMEIIRPVSIVLALPNGRSEYYQVIEDIHEVLGIQCHTMTIGALFVMLWNFGKFTGLTDELFITGPAGADLVPSIQKLLGPAFTDEGEPYSGATHTAK